ncbi:hypothetical protein HK405_003088 [Cladochytrium tenue]|nr:hypothetical protein HK405_003088 [Cladochytrium tenue]
MTKLYFTSCNPSGPPEEATFIYGPNCWKVLLTLLRKGHDIEPAPSNALDTRTTLAGRHVDGPDARVLLPSIELSSGELLSDSFRIAGHLEATHAGAPSVFAAGPSAATAPPAAVAAGRAYARLVDLGLGNSTPGWGVWFELSVAGIVARMPAGAARDYVVESAGLQVLVAPPAALVEELKGRARAGVRPFADALRERPGEFLQGPEPGFVDFVVFGRYAMLRNSNAALAKELWEDVDPEIAAWVDRMLDYFGRDKLAKYLRPGA